MAAKGAWLVTPCASCKPPVISEGGGFGSFARWRSMAGSADADAGPFTYPATRSYSGAGNAIGSRMTPAAITVKSFGKLSGSIRLTSNRRRSTKRRGEQKPKCGALIGMSAPLSKWPKDGVDCSPVSTSATCSRSSRGIGRANAGATAPPARSEAQGRPRGRPGGREAVTTGIAREAADSEASRIGPRKGLFGELRGRARTRSRARVFSNPLPSHKPRAGEYL